MDHLSNVEQDRGNTDSEQDDKQYVFLGNGRSIYKLTLILKEIEKMYNFIDMYLAT